MTITVMPEGGRVKHTAQFFYIKGVVKELPNRWSDIEYNIVDADGPDDVYFNIVDCRYFCGRSRESEETCPYKGADVTFKCQIKNHIDYKHTSYAAMLWSLNGARDCAIPVDMGVSVKWAKTFLGGGDYIYRVPGLSLIMIHRCFAGVRRSLFPKHRRHMLLIVTMPVVPRLT